MKKFLPRPLLSAYHFMCAFSAAFIYRFPAYKLTVIGVTGTNGKSTCVYMMNEIFKKSDYATCSASSIHFTIGASEEPNMLKMTMAGPFVLQKFLRKAVDAGCAHAILEITSEGVMQSRHRFIPLHTVVLTNMSPEHIERHGSFEAYRAQKTKLFRGARCVLINCDDAQAAHFLTISRGKKYGYTLWNPQDKPSRQAEQAGLKKFFVIRDVMERNGKSEFTFEHTDVRLSLPGEFNVRNAAEALIVATIHGIPVSKSKQALERIDGIPGRMEVVVENPVQVIVDYAHTPTALRAVYETLRSANSKLHQSTGGRNPKLICVLGAAGGGRDKWKRPEFGKLAATYCNYVILTDEDPYEEDPRQIIAEVKAGIPRSFLGACEEILDRRKAIARSLEVAKDKDVVIITGKGCEPYMITNKGKIPWDDRAIVREERKKRRADHGG